MFESCSGGPWAFAPLNKAILANMIETNFLLILLNRAWVGILRTVVIILKIWVCHKWVFNTNTTYSRRAWWEHLPWDPRPGPLDSTTGEREAHWITNKLLLLMLNMFYRFVRHQHDTVSLLIFDPPSTICIPLGGAPHPSGSCCTPLWIARWKTQFPSFRSGLNLLALGEQCLCLQ